jgi:hypothetical protein
LYVCHDRIDLCNVRSDRASWDNTWPDRECIEQILDVAHGELYRALDSYTSMTEINDYAEPNYDTSAKKIVFFESVPPVMTFLLQVHMIAVSRIIWLGCC